MSHEIEWTAAEAAIVRASSPVAAATAPAAPEFTYTATTAEVYA